MLSLLVSNTPEHLTEPEVREMFSSYGRVCHVVLVPYPEHRGRYQFVVVDFSDDMAAMSAMRALDGTVLRERRLKVEGYVL